MKGIHCLSRIGQERNMQTATDSGARADPERRVWRGAEPRQPAAVIALDLNHGFDSEWRKSGDVERMASRKIRDGKIDVMNQRISLSSGTDIHCIVRPQRVR